MNRQFNELRLTGSLPSPSAAGLRILELTSTDNFAYDELIKTILADPALSGRVIKIANAANRDGLLPVHTVAQATKRLGVRAVRSAALGFSLIADNRRGTARAFDFTAYWSNSLATAVAAHSLAQVSRFPDPASAFTCALLCDVGKLALACVHPERYSRLVSANAGLPDLALARAEGREFGIDHFEVTAELMAHWGLPEEFQKVALLRAQDPERSADDAADLGGRPDLLSLVRSGHLIARVINGSWDIEEARWRGLFLSLQRVGADLELDLDALLSTCDAIIPSFEEWGRLIDLPASSAGRFQEVALEMERRGVPSDLLATATGAAPEPVEAEAEVEELSIRDDLDLPLPLEEPPGGEVHTPIRVLVVEDDPQMLRLIAHYLKREGFELLTASSSAEGLSMALQHSPQIVVTDWMMPEMNGVDLCRTLRRSQAGARMHLVIVTACGNDEQVVEAFEAGVNDFVAKPFNPRILLARVRAAVRAIELRERAEAAERSQLRQVTELEIMARKLRAAALTDTLTDLPNRRYAMKRLKQEWESRERIGRGLAVTIIDIDTFKQVNDQFGHDTGDAVLRSVARQLQAHTRGSDTLCRLGGEEFIVLSVGGTAETAMLAAERLRGAVASKAVEHGDFHELVTVSLGVAMTTSDMETFDDLIKAADTALYRAKAEGRDRVCGAGEAAQFDTSTQSDRRSA